MRRVVPFIATSIAILALLCLGGTAQAWPWDHHEPHVSGKCYGPDGKLLSKFDANYESVTDCSARTQRHTVTTTVPSPSRAPHHPTAHRAVPTGHLYFAFCPDGYPPEELARRMAESLRLDSTGHRKVRGCHANPVQFLYGFRQADPGEHEHLANLTVMATRYLREDLTATSVPTNIEFYSSCLKGKSDDGDDVIMKCDPQRVPATVTVYKNKRTGAIVLKRNCDNPGLVPVGKPPCAYALVHTREASDHILSLAAMGNLTVEEEAACPITIQGPAAEGTMLKAGGYRPLVDMPEHLCDWEEVAGYVDLPIHKTGCVEVSPGWYAVRVPIRFATDRSLRLFFCLTERNGRTVEPIGALPEEYHRLADGSMGATVWYDQAEIPADHAGTILFWHWIR